MNNKNIDFVKKEKGAITLYVILAVVFFAVIIMGAYVIANRKLQAQYEAIAKEADMYNKEKNKIEDEEENSNIIPIYTADQFEKIGTNESVYIYQTEKTYDFSEDKQYVLKSDIQLEGKWNKTEWDKWKNSNNITCDSGENYRIGLTDGYVYFEKGSWEFVQNGWHQDKLSVYLLNGIKEINRVEVGDTVNYNPGAVTTPEPLTTAETGYSSAQPIDLKQSGLKWIVLGAEDGRLLITTTDSVVLRYIFLQGKVGYENGIKTLDKVANIYSGGNGADKDRSRSINIDDINRVTGYDPETAKCDAQLINGYGNEVTYYWNGTSDKPTYTSTNKIDGTLTTSHSLGFYWYDNDEFHNSKVPTTGSNKKEITKIKCTRYYYYPQSLSTNPNGKGGIDTSTQLYKDLFNSGKNYWLASHCVQTKNEKVTFGYRAMLSGTTLNFGDIYCSDNSEVQNASGVRPAVCLKSDVSLQSDGANTWNIVVNN